MIYNNQSLNNTKTNNKSQQHQQTHITHNDGSLKNTENNNIKRIYDHNNQSLNINNAPRPSNHSKNYNKSMNKLSPTTTNHSKLYQQYQKFTPNLHQQQQ